MTKLSSGHNADFDALAIGWLDMCLDENDRAIMALGMIPKDKYDPFLKMVLEKLAEPWCTGEGVYAGLLSPAEMAKGFKKEFIREVEGHLTKAIYRNAKMVV